MSIIYSNLSLTYLNGDEILLALESSNKSIEFNINNSKAYYYKSICNRYLGDYNNSLSNLNHSIKISNNPTNQQKQLIEKKELIEILNNKIKQESYFNNILKNENRIDGIKFENDPKFGRYITSTKLIKKDEQILRVKPYSSSLKKNSLSTYCSGCFQEIELSKIEECKCKNCQIYLECDKCKKQNNNEFYHSKELCDCLKLFIKDYSKLFENVKFDYDFRDNFSLILNVIKEKRESNTNTQSNIHKVNTTFISNNLNDVLGLSFVIQRNKNDISLEELYSLQSDIIIQVLNKANIKGRELLTKNEILHLIRINSSNSFSIYSEFFKKDKYDYIYGGALFPYASYFNHSCIPNSYNFIDSDGMIVFVATNDIEANTEITTPYIDITLRLELRRSTLLFQYGFFCNCNQCKFQSNLSFVDSSNKVNDHLIL